MMKRKILIPMKNALQEKADEYAMKQDCQTLQGMTRIESLSDGYILFIYANFSITCIRELPNGEIRVDDYRNMKFLPELSTWVSESLWEKRELERKAEQKGKVIEMAKNMAYNW